MTTASTMSNPARESERAFFDQLVDRSGDFDPFAPAGWQRLRRQFEAMRGAAPLARLLDVGCGTGSSRQIYRDVTQQYVGVDLSGESLRIAAARFPDDHFLQADACSLPLPDASFDAVAFSSVLHHIPRYSAALSEAWRVLRPGGLVFAFDPHLLHPAMLLFRWPKSPLYLSAGVSPNERPLLARSLRRAFKGAGFVSVRQRVCGGIPYRSVAPRLLRSLLSIYNAADWIAERTGLNRLIGPFVATAAGKPL